jgi:hypothetical protein
MFKKYFDYFNHACKSAKYFWEDYKLQKPVMILNSSIENIMNNASYGIDFSLYDNLEGPPFWLREYLQEYPDTVLPF